MSLYHSWLLNSPEVKQLEALLVHDTKVRRRELPYAWDLVERQVVLWQLTLSNDLRHWVLLSPIHQVHVSEITRQYTQWMRSIVEALNVLFEQWNLLLLLVYCLQLSVGVLGLFALNVSFEDLFLAVDVKDVDLLGLSIAVETECEELASLRQNHDFISVEGWLSEENGRCTEIDVSY